MARHPQMERISGGGTQTSISAESSGNKESEDENIGWRKCAMKLHQKLRKLNLEVIITFFFRYNMFLLRNMT
jgi:hypothetical protein